ncbi:MAG: isovaleryl-CoA dehydrogenase, partial [bacterium]|nr:isovaleryl-CoA dehydrogenase [bacterium]
MDLLVSQAAPQEPGSGDLRDFDLFAPTPEHELLAETLRQFVAREVEPQAAEHDRAERFNHALFKKAGDLGLLGVTIPEAYGGAGLDPVAAVQVFEALSTSDPGFGLAMLAHSILFAQNCYVNGNEEQRRRILPKVASGEWIGGMCMTEPGVGTDVLGMKTSAVREGDEYVLNGVKTFITNGGIDENNLGDIFIVYA